MKYCVSIILLICLFSAVKAQSYELVWSDEFDYSGVPDPNNWDYEKGAGGWGNNEWQYYTSDRAENCRVENGSLIIEAHKESYSGSNYTSARIISYHNQRYWTYGKVEARIKLPYGKGIWPACWMLGKNIFEGTNWPACGEIDIVELIGGGEGKDDKIYGTVHWGDANANHASYGGNYQLANGIFADTFHVFSIEWDQNFIKWIIDGQQYNVIDITPAHLSEFHESFFIIFNIAVGGNWPGYPDGSTVFPQKMEVDFIRVYQKGITSGINNGFNSENIAINPSLASDNLFVENIQSSQVYTIFNCIGKSEFSGIIEPRTSIDISNLNPGVYFIQLNKQEDLYPFKFIKVQNQ